MRDTGQSEEPGAGAGSAAMMGPEPTLWRIALACTRAEAEAAAAGESLPEGLAALVAEAQPDGGWRLVAWAEHPPDAALLARVARLAPSAPGAPVVAPEPVQDWVALASAGMPPVDAGRIHLHDRAHRGQARPGQLALEIEAGLAFGTGHHETTRGCLLAMQRLARGARPARVLDIGTGTGVLAIAAARLWRQADVRCGDIDPRAAAIAAANARANRLPLGRLRPVAAFGLGHRQLLGAAPYDLLLANILADPLVGLAPAIAPAVRPGGQLLLAGLLAHQRRRVAAAFLARGFRMIAWGSGAWPVLRLARRGPRPPVQPGPGPAVRAARRGTAGRRQWPDET